MLGTPRAMSSLHCATLHSTPKARTSSSVAHLTASAAKSCGRSQWNVLGTVESWARRVSGLMPGMMGTVMPAARAFSTKRK